MKTKSETTSEATVLALPTKLKKEILRFAWEIFIFLYPHKADCYEVLTSGASCKNCNSENFKKEYGNRKAKCADCRQENWFLAETFFDHVKEPQAHLGAIWLKQNGFVFNAKDLEELSGVSYSTAHEIEAKLSMFMYLQMKEEPNTLEVSSSAFDCLFLRRSFETPTKAHPIAEQEEMEKTNQNANAEKNGSESEMKQISKPFSGLTQS